MDLPSYVRASKETVVVEVFVQPRAARDAIAGTHGSALKLKVKAPPESGRANAAVEGLIAAVLRRGGVRVRAEVVSGFSSRNKRVEIRGATPEEVASVLR
ncbi:MAG: DUF167 domain-containing protein [Actinomycetota bacterium]